VRNSRRHGGRYPLKNLQAIKGQTFNNKGESHYEKNKQKHPLERNPSRKKRMGGGVRVKKRLVPGITVKGSVNQPDLKNTGEGEENFQSQSGQASAGSVWSQKREEGLVKEGGNLNKNSKKKRGGGIPKENQKYAKKGGDRERVAHKDTARRCVSVGSGAPHAGRGGNTRKNRGARGSVDKRIHCTGVKT